MTILDAWSIFFAAAALVGNTAFGAFQFSLEPKVIEPGERATLTLRLPESDLLQNTTDEDTFPEAQDEWLLKTDKLELLQQDYRKVKGEYIWIYQFTSYEVGDLSIPPLSVTLGPQSFSSERTVLKVQSPRNPEDTALRPDAPEMGSPWNWGLLFQLFLAIALASAAYWYFKKKWKRPTRRKVVLNVIPQEDPLEWLRKQLLILRAKLESKPEDSHAPDHWAAILREFAGRKTSRPVVAWTTREMQKRFGNDKQIQALCQCLQECDQYKFAPRREPGSPGAQTLRWIEQSEKLFL